MNPFSIVILAFVLATSTPNAALGATKLTIGQSTINPRSTPLWIGQEKGFFQKYGIDATFLSTCAIPRVMITRHEIGRVSRSPTAAGAVILGASVNETRPENSCYRQDDQQRGRQIDHQNRQRAARQDPRHSERRRHQLDGGSALTGSTLASICAATTLCSNPPATRSCAARRWNPARSMPRSSTRCLAKTRAARLQRPRRFIQNRHSVYRRRHRHHAGLTLPNSLRLIGKPAQSVARKPGLRGRTKKPNRSGRTDHEAAVEFPMRLIAESGYQDSDQDHGAQTVPRA